MNEPLEREANRLSEEYNPDFPLVGCEDTNRWDLEARRDNLRILLRDADDSQRALLSFRLALIECLLGG